MTNRGVWDDDWNMLLVHHKEAFLSVAVPLKLERWDPDATTRENTYDESTNLGFKEPVEVYGIVDTQVTDQKLMPFGAVERPDIFVYLSVPLLQDAGLDVDNRDRVIVKNYNGEDVRYDVHAKTVRSDMGGRVLELMLACRTVT